jgi:hypothetical protein
MGLMWLCFELFFCLIEKNDIIIIIYKIIY